MKPGPGHAPGTRVYCYICSRTFVLADGKTCPECGPWGAKHRAVEGPECQAFVRCASQGPWPAMGVERKGNDGHGHPCKLAFGHEGACVCDSCVPTPKKRETGT